LGVLWLFDVALQDLMLGIFPFDAYTATAERVMAKMDELIARGKVMDAPVV
jgi:hypothetical protein